MKNKLITLLLASLICVNFTACAGCGSPEPETVATVDTETELETETETLKQDTSINGFSYKQGIVEGLEATDTTSEGETKTYTLEFEDIEPKTMYVIESCSYFGDIIENTGLLYTAGSYEAGAEVVVNGKAVFNGEGDMSHLELYRIETEDGSLRTVKTDRLTDAPPAPTDTDDANTTASKDTTTTPGNDNSSGNSNNTSSGNQNTPNSNENNLTPEEQAAYEAFLAADEAAGTMADVPYNPNFADSDGISPEEAAVLDEMQNLDW